MVLERCVSLIDDRFGTAGVSTELGEGEVFMHTYKAREVFPLPLGPSSRNCDDIDRARVR